MNIDPRTLKELLQLQILNKMDFITGGSPSGDETNHSDFSEMLNSILQSAGIQTPVNEEALQPSGTKAALKPMNANPAFSFGFLNSSPGHLPEAVEDTEYDPIIMDASRRNGIQPSLVKAVIDAESSFNSQAVSKAGAKGLMQLMDRTGQGLGVTNPFDPVQNIHGGTKYLSNLLNKYNGNEGVALAAYNAGSGRMSRLGITNDDELMEKLHLLPKETQNYVSKVMRLQHQYEG